MGGNEKCYYHNILQRIGAIGGVLSDSILMVSTLQLKLQGKLVLKTPQRFLAASTIRNATLCTNASDLGY